LMDRLQININELLESISKAQDLVSPRLSNHHRQVAYLAFRLAEQIDLPTEQQRDIYLAGLLHDIGALSTPERLELIESEPINIFSHGFRGARLLNGFAPLMNAAHIIKFHHLPWNHGEGRSFEGEDVSFASHIIHLADRTCALVLPGENIIMQLEKILAVIRKQAGAKFEPSLVDALCELGSVESIWLDLVSDEPNEAISDSGLVSIHTAEIDDVVGLAYIFSHMIDFRSRFTAVHSAGVASTAEKLAQLIGFSPYECKMMLIAGYLHDLGKIAIDSEILEKSAKLTEDEFNTVRVHTYYTYHLLKPISQLQTINIWASYHHEKLDGTGYPFHITGDSLPLGSRIMAVADIFAAITEDRPYRKGMDFNGTREILNQKVADNAIDGSVVNILLENYDEINSIRKQAQLEAAEHYDSFMRQN
jgi:HD-GYP domain-containing protein (c-di-GMP phosphodiesterase class II)